MHTLENLKNIEVNKVKISLTAPLPINKYYSFLTIFSFSLFFHTFAFY